MACNPTDRRAPAAAAAEPMSPSPPRSQPPPELPLVGGALCLDFINTESDEVDWLESYTRLVRWCRHAGGLCSETASSLLTLAERAPREARSVARRARRLRASLVRALTAAAHGGTPDPGDLAAVNRELAQALGNLRLTLEPNGLEIGYDSDALALERALWPVARSAADLFASDQLARVKQCDGETCSWMFLDTSRSGRRRWCDMRVCGNRAKARRYYARNKRRSAPRRRAAGDAARAGA